MLTHIALDNQYQPKILFTFLNYSILSLFTIVKRKMFTFVNKSKHNEFRRIIQPIQRTKH
jgi:hypothetical protein